MAKATKPGNIAVPNIQSTVTNELTVSSTGTTVSQQKKAESAAAKTSTTSKTTSTAKSSGSSGSYGGSESVSAGGIGTVPTVNPFAEQAIQNFMGYDGSGGIIGEFQPVEAQYVNTQLIGTPNYKREDAGFNHFLNTPGNYTAFDNAMDSWARTGHYAAEGQLRDDDSALRQALNNLVNREPFSYNENDDRFWQLYKDRYMRQGAQAMKDTIAQAAGLTGGYGSSYAALAGQASYNDWLSRLMDVLPELEKTAYGRWQDKGDELARIFDLTNKRYQNHYEAYNDEMNRASDYYENMWDNYNTARSLALTADKQLLNNYQINQDTYAANADRKLKADMANQGARFDTESFNAKAAEQAWADQLKLLQYQLLYAYT